MKILLIITGLGMGGAERQVCDLADKFISLGHDVLLISMTPEVINTPQAMKAKVVTLDMVKTISGFVKAYYEARKLIKSFNPDIVHSHMVHANLFARLLRLSIHMPKLICTAHNSNEGGRLRILSYRLTDFLCDFSTNVSQEATELLIKQGAASASRMLPIHNGIDTEKFIFNVSDRKRLRGELGISDTTPLLLAVGRLNVAKNYPNLLYALHRLPKQYNSVQLAIIGVGEELTKLTELVHSMRLNMRVHFLGLRHDVNEWMSAADIFVLSSSWEGFGLVVAEAMACERVVVATDCGGVKEVIGEYGILVSSENSQALANGIIEALRLEPEYTNDIGALARKRIIEHYSLNKQVERWLELYKY
ncbi:glycosyltransferase [Aeromonas enteropelogenes]|uniref:glycosyltransferase n=1 Tax=Aeromonas enteropelogenes TaxID=29489 RepID=UPI003BA085A1